MSEDQKEEEKKAWAYSLKALNVAAKSRSQMNLRLIEKGYSPHIAEKVISDLEKVGYVDDKRFAESIFRQLTSIKGCGRNRLIFEWKRKGLLEESWAPLLENFSDEDEYRVCQNAAYRKWDSVSKNDLLKRRKKVHDFLVRRGFSFQVVGQVIQELVQKDNSESCDDES